MPIAGQDAIAVCQMHIGDVFAPCADGFGEVGFFDAHVEEIGHGGDRWAAHGFTDFNALSNGAGPPLFVAVQGFYDQKTATRLGMRCDVSFENSMRRSFSSSDVLYRGERSGIR